MKPVNKSPQQVSAQLTRYFEKIQARQPDRPLQVRIVSGKPGIDFHFSSASADQPFHGASVGKVFTAALVGMLAERGIWSLDDPAAAYLPPDGLRDLFCYRGVDHAGQITLAHLLGHTSGVADYFEGKTNAGKSFIDLVLSEPHTRWTPEMLVDFTRARQAAVGAPGQVFNYSDTGYILLGQMIEQVTGKPFHTNLEDEFFRPLEMRDSYLMFHGQPANQPAPPIEPVWFNDAEISRYPSLSCDWAGGGVVSTTADLVKFSRALRGGQLLSTGILERMDHPLHRFRSGIYYGLGMMEIRFKEFFFLLGGLPRVKGHIGILATHLFYDPLHDAHIVMNFGDTRRMVKSFQALIEIENTLSRMS